MRAFLQIALCCCVLAVSATAQRGGMGGGGGHGGFGGGHGGISGGFHGGFGGFNGGFNRGGSAPFGGAFMGTVRGFRSAFAGGFGSSFYPYGGIGFGLGLGYYGYGYPYDYGSGYGYGYGYGSPYPASSYPAYTPSPNVTVVYPSQAQSAPAYSERATPVTREYDQYGQEIRRSGASDASPIYLVAFKDHVIRAAAAYWVDGKTLHYVTLQHEEKQVPTDTVDHDLSLQLNRERGLAFNLPQ